MSPQEYLSEFLVRKKAMQIASVSANQPWICTVFFVADEAKNLYWLSLPSRRHSLEIAANNKVAVAIAVKTDWPIIGIQSGGKASVVTERAEVKRIMKLYVAKYNQGKDFYDNFVKGTNQHLLYKFQTDQFVLFDEEHFSDDPRQMINL